MKRTALLIAAIFSLAGCATSNDNVSYWQPSHLPALQKIEIVPTEDMAVWCPKYPTAKACADRNYPAGICTVYVRTVYKDDAELLEHERCHCAGYDHEIQAWGYGNLNVFQMQSHLEVAGAGPRCPDRR